MKVKTTKQPTIPKRLLEKIISEDSRRKAVLFKGYNPLSGENAPGKRARIVISDFMGGKPLFIPVEMLRIRFVRVLIHYGSIEAYVKAKMPAGIN